MNNPLNKIKFPIRVFLSYSIKDKLIAKKIADYIKKQGIYVWFDIEDIKPGDSWKSQIDNELKQTDYILILLSKNSMKSNWTRDIANNLVNELVLQDKRIIPVITSPINQQELPNYFENIQMLDLRNNFENKLFQFCEQISNAPSIDFSQLDGLSFEKLTSDLLKKLGFFNISEHVRLDDHIVDLTAEYRSKDPFRAINKEIWIIECKLYNNEKADLKSIYQLTNYLLTLPENYKAALITNGRITSTSIEWLKNREYKNRIRIIDGYELKNLLLNYPNIIKKFFSNKKGV